MGDKKKLTKEEKKELIRQKREERKKSGFWADFKKFITKGNVLDMAVGVVIGTAFNAIVNSLVKQVIMPFVTYLTKDFLQEGWQWTLVGETVSKDGVKIDAIIVEYGEWFQTIIDFFIIAFTVFVVVRIIRGFERKLRSREIAQQEAIAAKKKAEEDAKAAEAKALADAKAAAEKAALEEFYANVKEQSRLLREISESVKK